MKNIKNIEAAKKLVKRYRSITVEEIDKARAKYRESRLVLQELTGFGDSSTCTLCDSLYKGCYECIWSIRQNRHTLKCINTTYKSISNFKSSEGLLKAYRKRADVLEELINKYKEKQYGR